MNQHVLVAYASRAGSTAEVAQAIAQVLREGGAEKDYSSVHPLVRWVMIHVLHSLECDWRDWDRIRTWAASLAPGLNAGRPALAATG